MCVHHVSAVFKEAGGRHWVPRNWNYRGLWMTRFCKRNSALRHWAISPASTLQSQMRTVQCLVIFCVQSQSSYRYASSSSSCSKLTFPISQGPVALPFMYLTLRHVFPSLESDSLLVIGVIMASLSIPPLDCKSMMMVTVSFLFISLSLIFTVSGT